VVMELPPVLLPGYLVRWYLRGHESINTVRLTPGQKVLHLITT